MFISYLSLLFHGISLFLFKKPVSMLVENDLRDQCSVYVLLLDHLLFGACRRQFWEIYACIYLCIYVCVCSHLYADLAICKDINLILNYLKYNWKTTLVTFIKFQTKVMKSLALRGKQMSLSSRDYRTSSRTQRNPGKLRESGAGKKWSHSHTIIHIVFMFPFSQCLYT